MKRPETRCGNGPLQLANTKGTPTLQEREPVSPSPQDPRPFSCCEVHVSINPPIPISPSNPNQKNTLAGSKATFSIWNRFTKNRNQRGKSPSWMKGSPSHPHHSGSGAHSSSSQPGAFRMWKPGSFHLIPTKEPNSGEGNWKHGGSKSFPFRICVRSSSPVT